MEKHLFIILVFIASFSYSQKNELVKIETDTTNIRIGEQIKIKITVGETENVIMSNLQLEGLEIIDSTKIDTLKNSLVKKYILTGFDSGSYYIPQQQVFIKNQNYLTDSILINVATVKVDTTKLKKHSIKPIKQEPYVLDDFKFYLYVLLVALTVIGLVIYLIISRKRKEEKIVSSNLLPPDEEAVSKLKILDEKLLWQNNKVKEYYSELTEIVRCFIENELELPALETTTDEVLEMLKSFKNKYEIPPSKEAVGKLKSLLEEADLVKFAKSKPLANEIEGDRKDAEFIIYNLNPKPIIEDEELE